MANTWLKGSSSAIKTIRALKKKLSKGTYPTRCCEIIYTNQVVLQLCQLLEILQADETVLQPRCHFCDFLQCICKENSTEGIRTEQMNPGQQFYPWKTESEIHSQI